MTHGIDTSFLVALESVDHLDHVATRALLARLVTKGDRLALAPQVLAEFLHVTTDARRFTQPLDMAGARRIAEGWWRAPEVEQVFPGGDAVTLFLSWMDEHRLGRRRLLDTLLAATYRSAGVTSILTLNPSDFEVLGDFACLTLGKD